MYPPTYLLWSSMVTPCSSVKGRSSLRSASARKYVVPGTHLVFDQRSFTVASPPSGNRYHLLSAILSLRLSFPLNSKLTSSALLMDYNDYSTSTCTFELCKNGTI